MLTTLQALGVEKQETHVLEILRIFPEKMGLALWLAGEEAAGMSPRDRAWGASAVDC